MTRSRIFCECGWSYAAEDPTRRKEQTENDLLDGYEVHRKIMGPVST